MELCLDAAGGEVASQFASFCPREGVLLDICEQEWEGIIKTADQRAQYIVEQHYKLSFEQKKK